METRQRYGLLLNDNIKLHRLYFRECVKLLGIYVVYRAPLPGKHYTTYAEIESNYAKPVLVGCLFHEHPDQKTLKKIGWVSELQEGASLIEVDYDLPGLLQGALFIVPSGIDEAKGRLFRVTQLSNSMMYPSSVTCQIVPEYEDAFKPENHDYPVTSYGFNLIDAAEDEEKDPRFN